MHFGGRVGPNHPDPLDDARRQASDLGIAAAGLVPQPHLDDWGVAGISTHATGYGDESSTVEATVSRMYTVWRNPDDHDDPANLAALTDDMRRSLDLPIPPDLPTWILRQRQRLLYPALWEAVHTHWFAQGRGDEISTQDAGDLLVAHVDHILHNQFRDENGLDNLDEGGWDELVTRDAVTPASVIVDRIRVDGVALASNPFVLGIGAPLPDGRVLTAALPRDQLEWITLEFTADAG